MSSAAHSRSLFICLFLPAAGFGYLYARQSLGDAVFVIGGKINGEQRVERHAQIDRPARTVDDGAFGDHLAAEPAGGAKTLLDPKLYDGSAAKPIKKLPNSDPVVA